MVPALLEFVFKAHFPGILGARVIIIIGMMVPRSAHAMDQAKSAAFAIITAPFGTVRVIGQTEFQVIQADVILIVPIIEIILDGEFFRQVGSLFLDQRRDDTVVGDLDGLDSAQGLDLGAAVQQIPFGRELTDCLGREVILEQNDFAPLEVRRCGRLRTLLPHGGSDLIFVGLLVFLILFLAVEEVVHAFLDLVADIVLDSLLGALAETPEDALGGGGAANQRKERCGEDVLFHNRCDY